MYRCSVCSAVSRPGDKLCRHTIYREVLRSAFDDTLDKQIASELPVCGDCQVRLARGISLATMLRVNGRPEPVPVLQVERTQAPVEAPQLPPAIKLSGKVMEKWRAKRPPI